MENLQNITLPNGVVLRIMDGIVTCTDADQSSVHLTLSQQKMIRTLAQKLNFPVSIAELYAGYTDTIEYIDTKGIRENVAKMKNTFPGCVKDYILSERGYGYKLVSASAQEAHKNTGNKNLTNSWSPECNDKRITELAGEYYGFYLDPLGKGYVLGSYFFIYNAGTADNTQMRVCAIVGIRDKEILHAGVIQDIFTSHPSDYYDSFVKFKRILNDNDKRCFWLQGSLSRDDNLVTMHLASRNSHETWTVILDIAEYLCCGRDWDHDNDLYRGGLGLVLALKTAYGTISFRLGLVRKALLSHELLHADEERKEWLKIQDDSKNAVWKPLELSTQLDKLWYDWFMNF